jgi:hypothetical protein
MVKRRHWKMLLAGMGAAALVLAAVATTQYLSEEPEAHSLSQSLPPESPRPGRVVLDLSSAMLTLEAGPPGAPIAVESSFDPEVYRLDQRCEYEPDGGWTYHLDFHERSLLHISVISIWLGKRSPEVRVEIPADLPIDLVARMEGGHLAIDLAGMAVRSAKVDLDRGVLGLTASDPLDSPMERLDVKGRVGTMQLLAIGNASPKRLEIRHGIGAALVNLDGRWRSDAEVGFQVAFGKGELQLPTGVRIEGIDKAFPQMPAEDELPPPTLRISTHFDIGDIRITD